MLFFLFLAAARKIARLPEKNILPDSGGCSPFPSPPAHTPMNVLTLSAAGRLVTKFGILLQHFFFVAAVVYSVSSDF